MVKEQISLRKVLKPIAFIVKEQRSRKVKKLYLKNNPAFFMMGFLSESQNIYPLNFKNSRNYLSNYQQMKTGKINGAAAYWLNNKLEFSELIKDVIKVPESLALVNHGRFYSYSEKMKDLEDLEGYLRSNINYKIVHKPIFGAEGKGVSIIKWQKNQIYMNGEVIDKTNLKQYIMDSENYFLSEYIQQSHFSNNLFAKSLNTIRLLTMIDPKSKKAFVAASSQRVGTNESMPTDNFRRKGLSVAIDMESGSLGKATRLGRNGQLEWYENHPDTQIQLTGQQIPNWSKLKEKIEDVADFIYEKKGIKYVGWDLVITEDGYEVLEGNSWPGVTLHQVHKGLLKDNRVREFYKYHKII